MNNFDDEVNGKIDENPWQTEDIKKSIVPEPAAELVQIPTEFVIQSPDKNDIPDRALTPVLPSQAEEEEELEEVDNERIYSLDTTAEEPELKQKCLLLQQKIKSNLKDLRLGEIRKLDKAQIEHRRQASENKVLREYVANLLHTTSTTGVNKFGVPIAAHRTSSKK